MSPPKVSQVPDFTVVPGEGLEVCIFKNDLCIYWMPSPLNNLWYSYTFHRQKTDTTIVDYEMEKV
jgi:hypothetical protein